MKRKLLIIDTETGGLNAESHSILSLAALVWNQGAIEDEFYTLIVEPTIVVGEGAMSINGLDLNKVREEGMSPSLAVARLQMMLDKHDMRRDIRLCGQNVAFDVGFLKRLYRLAGKTDKEYSARFSHRALCTQTAALLLEQAGRIVLPGGSASLDALVKFWNVPLDRSTGHHALTDAKATAEVLKKELAMIGWA